MKPKRPHVTTLEDVMISRENETAIIEYKDPNIWVTHLTIGSKIYTMSDQDILDSHNNSILAYLEWMRNYKYVAVEVPPEKLQIDYFSPGGYWTTRGDVLRCEITESEGETIISVDDRDSPCANLVN